MSTAVFASKSGLARRRDITRAAAGKGLRLPGMQERELVVDWGEATDHVHTPSPNAAAANYEWFRESAGGPGAGAHLVFNAFW